ncbi:ammonium transporter [Streptomycetaceae bacterium NBC_01309]
MGELVDSGNTAWLMTATAMVLLMAPGLAFFYGGMVRSGQVVAMLKMCFACVACVSLLWWAMGYSLAFGPDAGGLGVIGTFEHAFLRGVGESATTGDVPTVLHAAFQMSFAVVTTALISGSVAGRAKMTGWVAFVCVWTLLVYVPMAHWVFEPEGWVADQVGAVDFSGGTVVELGSGAAGLALAVVAGKRADFADRTIRPHNIPLVVIGASLLWFGWFGFNAGAYLSGTGATTVAFLNTQLAAGAAMAGWALPRYVQARRVSLVDMCMGAIIGMVAMTPLSAGVSPVWATVIGFVAGLTGAYAVHWKYRLGVDDTLDVVGIHGWGGLFGMIAAGFAATGAVTGTKGLFYGGSWTLLGNQLVAVLLLGLYSFVMTGVIGMAVEKTVGLRRDESTPAEEEQPYAAPLVVHLRELTDTLRGAGEPAPQGTATQTVRQLRVLLARRAAPESESDSDLRTGSRASPGSTRRSAPDG